MSRWLAIQSLSVFIFCLIHGSSAQAEHSLSGLKILEEMEQGLIGLAEHALPSVVNISPYVPPSPSIRRQSDSSRSRPTNAGAGVIINGAQGYLITNSHVVKQAEKVKVTLYGGEELIGTVLGTDEETDLAVVKIESPNPLPEIRFGDSSKLKVGQMVVAIGNPYGLHDTLSFGVISGLNRENVNISRYEDFIQTDASINPGNSGGPLLNIRGEIIGINTAIINYAQSIGFAIPSNIVKYVALQIIENGAVSRGWMGVGIEFVPEEVAVKENISKREGVLVNSVFEDQPASKAGVQVGDIILKVAGTPVVSPNSMIRLIGNITPGQMVDLEVLRDGVRKTFRVRLTRKKDQVQRLASFSRKSPLGLELADLDQNLKEKFQIKKDHGVVVTQVEPQSLADLGGMKTGDLITSLNGKSIVDKKQIKSFLNEISGNEVLSFLVERQNDTVPIKLLRKME